MKRSFLRTSLCILFSLAVTFSIAVAGDLPNTWTEIDPAVVYPEFEYNGLTPACSGSPTCTSDKFTFFVKGGCDTKILVYFQGGGACWDSMNCLYVPTYYEEQNVTLERFQHTQGMGILDTEDWRNPFKDWTIVFIPYCTGDLFWGANDYDYPDYLDQIPNLDSWTIQHRGFVNFQVVLKWLKDNVSRPRKIFVTGSSAGSYGATMAFPYIKQAYPLSRGYLLGDAGAGVTEDYFDTVGIYNWEPQYPEWIFPDGHTPGMTLADLYMAFATVYPFSKLAQYETAWDSTQAFFYNVSLNIHDPSVWEDGTPYVWCDWHEQMLDYTYETADNAPNYRYYIGAGTDHTILLSSKFYTEKSAGISFAAWVGTMVYNPFGAQCRLFQGLWKNWECED